MTADHAHAIHVRTGAPVSTGEATQPNIVFFLWDNLGWGEVGCFAQCTRSRSAILTGRHPIRWDSHCPSRVGRTRGEISIAQTLADSGYATGMWGKWQVGSDPEQRSPVDFGFDEAVWSPRAADEVMWAMQSYFPEEDVTSAQ